MLPSQADRHLTEDVKFLFEGKIGCSMFPGISWYKFGKIVCTFEINLLVAVVQGAVKLNQL